jgi:tetratricopeptide (TPR) repeat protein
LKLSLETLPPGEDAILVMDVSLDVTTVQSATASPKKPTQLIELASIVYDDMEIPLEAAKNLTESRSIANSDARALNLSKLLSSGKCLHLQAVRLEHLIELTKRGLDTAEVWNAIGGDCFLSGGSHRSLESSLAQYCHEFLQSNLAGMDESTASGAQALVSFLGRCRIVINRTSNPASAPGTAMKRVAVGIINRETEASSLVDFLDSRRLKLCQLLGREQIGKSIVLEKALAQSALPATSFRIVKLNEAVTAEYLLAAIIYGQTIPPADHATNIDGLLARLPSALKRYRLVILEDGHHLLRGDTFRNADIEKAVQRLAAEIRDTNCQLIVISRRSLPEGLLDSPRVAKQWIHGFEGRGLQHGIAFLDSQLRRVGLSPSDVDEQSKREFVTLLGGHPVALGLAADAILEDGDHEVLKQLHAQAGFWRTYVERLVRSLELTSDEDQTLHALSGCHTPIDREVIQQALPFSLQPPMRRLISYCLVDVLPDGRIWLSSLLRIRWRLDALPDALQKSLHEKAAEWYRRRSEEAKDLESAVQAEYHGHLAGVEMPVTSGILDGLIRSAWTLYDQQQYDRAKKIADQILNRKRNRDLVKLSALIDSRCFQFDTALTKAREVFTEDPTDSWFLFQIAKAALDADRTDVVEDLVRVAKVAGVEDDRLAVVEGRMLLRQNRLVEAASAFERARAASRWNVWPYFYLGRTYLRLGELSDAVEVLEEGLQFYEDNNCRNSRVRQMLRGLLAQTYLFQGEDEAAEKILSLMDHEASANPEIAQAIAMFSLKKDGVNEANEAFKRLRRVATKRPDDRCAFHLYYGMFLERTGNLAAASEEFIQAHRAVSTNVFALLRLAEVLFNLAIRASKEGAWEGEEDPAAAYASQCRVYVRKILDLSPDNHRAKSLQEDLFQQFGQRV